MKLVAPAQDLTQDQDIAKDNNYGNTTFAAKPNVAELDVPEDIDKLDLVGGEEMEAVRIVLLLVHLQHPPVRVALNADDKIVSRSQNAKSKPENERLIYVYGCSIPSFSSCALAHIVDNAPTLDELQLMVDLHVVGLVGAVALEDDLGQVLGIHRYLPHHKHLPFPIAKLLPGKLHLERQAWVVHGELGCWGEAVLLVRDKFQAS